MQVCPLLPVMEKDQCQQFAEVLVPVAIDWLRSSVTPEQLCAQAGVCGAAVAQEPAALVRARAARRKTVRTDLECSVCEYVVNTVKAELGDPVQLQQIKQQALQACAALPADISATCTDLVTTYGDMLVAMIESLDAQSSCVAVGMCAPQVLRKLPVPALPKPLLAALTVLRQLSGTQSQSGHALTAITGNVCDMCRLTVVEVHTLVSNPAVQAQIVNYTKGLCDALGPPLAGTCGAYVDQYAPVLFTAIEQYLAQGDILCQSLGMCDKPHAAQVGSDTKQLGEAVRGVSMAVLAALGADASDVLAKSSTAATSHVSGAMKYDIADSRLAAKLTIAGSGSLPRNVRAGTQQAEEQQAARMVQLAVGTVEMMDGGSIRGVDRTASAAAGSAASAKAAAAAATAGADLGDAVAAALEAATLEQVVQVEGAAQGAMGKALGRGAIGKAMNAMLLPANLRQNLGQQQQEQGLTGLEAEQQEEVAEEEEELRAELEAKDAELDESQGGAAEEEEGEGVDWEADGQRKTMVRLDGASSRGRNAGNRVARKSRKVMA